MSSWSGADRIACTIVESSIDRAKRQAGLLAFRNQISFHRRAIVDRFCCGRRPFSSLYTGYLVVSKSSRLTG